MSYRDNYGSRGGGRFGGHQDGGGARFSDRGMNGHGGGGHRSFGGGGGRGGGGRGGGGGRWGGDRGGRGGGGGNRFNDNPGQSLRKVAWDSYTLVPFQKDFYNPHPNIAQADSREVTKFREQHQITIQR